MKKISSYTELLAKETQLQAEVDLTKEEIRFEFDEAISPKNLFAFLEDEINRQRPTYLEDRLDLKEYLVNLTMDYVFTFVSSRLLVSKKPKLIDVRRIIKSMIDRYYYNNQDEIKNKVAQFVDEKIAKWSKK